MDCQPCNNILCSLESTGSRSVYVLIWEAVIGEACIGNPSVILCQLGQEPLLEFQVVAICLTDLHLSSLARLVVDVIVIGTQSKCPSLNSGRSYIIEVLHVIC